MVTQYRDNYPYNIEAPQRVYVQYSQDIAFDYSTGNYPLGESFEGFIWETVYNPLPHSYGELTLGRHVWMRWRVGEKDNWTFPMRFTDSFTNIESTTLEQVNETNQSRFRFKYTLDTGEIIYSEYMTITNGIDGRGIRDSRIVDLNLYLDYTDDTTQNLGRVVGYNGNGIPVGTVNPGEILFIDGSSNITWTQFIDILDNNLSATSPVDYANGIISHLNTDGNKHIPVGGNNTDVLVTDGSGNYSWEQRITTIPINDLAGSGATTQLWSADKLTAMFAGINAFGIKYSVALISDLAGIVGMVNNDQAVVEEDRYVYKYNGSVWNQFFILDAPHNHNSLYYTKSELNTSLAGGQVHWNNLTNVPTLYDYWTINGNSGTSNIDRHDVLSIVGSGGVSTSLVGNTLTISNSGIYSEGAGIDILASVISHEDTSSIINTGNLNGTVLQNLTFDGFGHVLTSSSINLDGRYSLLSHNHALLTRGLGLTGSNYNGSAISTFAVDFAGNGAANTVARSDHSHTNTGVTVTTATFTPPGSFYANSGVATKFTYADGTEVVNIFYYAYYSAGILLNNLVTLGTIPSGYRPLKDYDVYMSYKKSDGSQDHNMVTIYGSTEFPSFHGQIKVQGGFGDGGTGVYLSFTITYVVNP